MLGPNLRAWNRLTSASLDTANAGQLGRQTQLISLLDRLLFVLQFAASNKETKLVELAELDNKIRSFLEVVLSGLELRPELISVHVALCIR